MPIQTFDFMRAPLLRDQNNPIADIFPGIVEGRLQGKQDVISREEAERKKKKEELTQYFLENYGPREKEAEIALKEAQAKYMPFTPEMLLARGAFGQGAQETEALKNMFNAQVKKQEMGSSRNKLPANFVTKQLNAELAQKSRQFLQPIMEISQEFLGGGGEYRLRSLVNKYKSEQNPNTKKELSEKLIQLALANKLTKDYAIDILAAQSINPTVHAQKEQKTAIMQGWPATLRAEVPNLPQEILSEANKRHDKTIERLGDVRSKFKKTLEQKYGNYGGEGDFDQNDNFYNEDEDEAGVNNIASKFNVSSEVAQDIIDTAVKYQMTVDEVYKQFKDKL